MAVRIDSIRSESWNVRLYNKYIIYKYIISNNYIRAGLYWEWGKIDCGVSGKERTLIYCYGTSA